MLNVIAGIILVVSGGVLLWSFILRVWFKKSGIIAVLISIILIVFCVPPSVSVLHVLPFVYSETNDPEDYLQMGDDVRIFMEDIYLVFPAQIPSSGIEQRAHRMTPAIYKETTQYHYWYEYGFAPELDIFAQWEVSQELLIRERERILRLGEQYELQQESKGDWEYFIIEFTDNPLKTENSIFRVIFACNYGEGIVRYGAYVSVSNNDDMCREAYYEKMEW